MIYNKEYERALKYSNFGYYKPSPSDTQTSLPLHFGDKLHQRNQLIYADWLQEHGWDTTSELLRHSISNGKEDEKEIEEHVDSPKLELIGSPVKNTQGFKLSIPNKTTRRVSEHFGNIDKNELPRILKDFEGHIHPDTVLQHAPEHYGTYLEKHAKTDEDKLTAMLATHGKPSYLPIKFESHDRKSVEALENNKHVLYFPNSSAYKGEDSSTVPYFLYAPVRKNRTSISYHGHLPKAAKADVKEHFNGLVQESE